jgi:hypothetical protein
MLPTSAPRRLGTTEKLLVVGEVLAVYCRVRWLMSRKDVADAVADLRRPGRLSHSAPAFAEGFESFRLAALVGRVLRLLPTDSRCLMRSLVLVRMLARRGVPTTLVIGVRTQPEFGAHAWVEQTGQPILEPGDTAQGRLAEI